jgi:hypothetical protein
MARKDKPYLPLYVQDFLTDEKLIECSSSATGVYIRIMCVLHKCTPYGKLLLKQNSKQNDSKIKLFADRFAKHLPYPLQEIIDGLTELIEEGCLIIEDNSIYQKRMFEDGRLSLIRSESGINGSEIKKKKKEAADFAKAKLSANGLANRLANGLANSEIDNDIVYNTSNYTNISSLKYLKETFETKKVTDLQEQNYFSMIVVEMNKIWNKAKPSYSFMQETDYPALLQIAYLIGKRKNISKYAVINVYEDEILKSFQKITDFLLTTTNKFLMKLPLSGIAVPKNFQSIEEEMRSMIENDKEKKLETKRITQKEWENEL